MVLQGVWNFVKRHKKKVIFGGVLAGGAYYGWKLWRATRDASKLMEQLFKELEKSEGLGAEAKDEKETKFQHRQEVSDDYLRKGLQTYLARHKRCFKVDECFAKVREAKDKAARLSALRDLQMECICNLISAFYSLHVLVLLHRVIFNIGGREATGQEERSAAITEFVESTDYVLEKCPAIVSGAVRDAVKDVAADIEPTQQVTFESFVDLVQKVCRKVDKAILEDCKAPQHFLPSEGQDRSNAGQGREQVKKLLDEARDYLESSQLLEVFRSVTTAAARRLTEELAARDPQAAALKDGGSVQFAKLFGSTIKLSESLLSAESPDGAESGSEVFIRAFAEHTAENGEKTPVIDLCRALYFQESSFTS